MPGNEINLNDHCNNNNIDCHDDIYYYCYHEHNYLDTDIIILIITIIMTRILCTNDNSANEGG